METPVETNRTTADAEKIMDQVFPQTRSKWYGMASQERGFEQARFGWMAILLSLQSCVGAIACMLVSINGSSITLLAVCAAVTMGSNALFIALASPRWCLAGFYASMIVNTILILFNLP